MSEETEFVQELALKEWLRYSMLKLIGYTIEGDELNVIPFNLICQSDKVIRRINAEIYGMNLLLTGYLTWSLFLKL